jgi:hypothetical protein
MKQEVKIGQTDYTVLVLFRDSTTGLAKTGLTGASAGMNAAYTRVETDNDVTITEHATLHTLATPALTDVHLDWGFLEVDAVHAPGLYRLDLPDEVFATGAWSAVVSLVCTGCDTVHLEFVLVPESPYTGVNLSMYNGTACHAAVTAGIIPVDIHQYLGTDAHAAVTAGIQPVDVHQWLGTDAHAAVVNGVPIVEIHDTSALGTQIGDIHTDVGTVHTDVDEILTRVPDATAGAAGGLFIAGSNAATTVASLSVTGQLDAGNVLVDAATVLTGNVSMADGLTIPAPSTGNRAGVTVTGNGTGAGVIVTGGSTSGNALTAIGGAPNGFGAYVGSDGTADGIRIEASDTGHGVQVLGGTTSGDGIKASASTSGNGMTLTGVGAGTGLRASGGLTGNGMESVGGGTSGDGIYAKAAGAGNGLACHGGGISGDGIYAVADNDGNGVEFVATANANGMLITGSGSGEGVSIFGGTTGDGIDITAGVVSGSGVYIVAPTSGHGIEVTGGGAGSGISALGGATSGAGILATGGVNHANADGIRAVAGGALGSDIDADLTWSAAWDAEVQSECNDALVAYDPPTDAEMILRTLPAADYTVVGDLGVVQTADHTADITAIKAITDLLPSGIKKNTALTNFEFYMVLAVDHISPALLKVVDCQRSIDGAAFANCNTAVATEVSDGVYKLNLAASDLNGNVISFKFTEATCDTRIITVKTST